MSTFRQYGGIGRAPTNNIVKNHISNNDNLGISHILGLENTTIVCKSNMDICGNIIVYGNALFNQNVDISGSLIVNIISVDNLDVSHNLYVGGDASFNQNVDISGNLVINGDASFNQKLYVNGDASFNQNVDISGNLNVLSDVSFNQNLYVNGDASFNQNVDISGNLNVLSDVSFNQNLYVNGDASFNQNVDISGNLVINGDASFNQNLYVSGDVSFNQSLYVGGDASFNQSLYVDGDASFNQNMDISGNLYVGGDASFNQNLYVNGAITTTKDCVINLVTIGTGEYSSYIGNTILGQNALQASLLGSISGGSNTSIGCNSGFADTTIIRNNNTFIGAETSAFNIAGISNSTALGYQATITASNQIVLGTSSEYVYIPSTTAGSPTAGALFVAGGIGVTGDVYANAVYASSDYRLKKNIVSLFETDYSIDFLKPVTYNLKKNENKTQHIGFIAHELQESLPFLVTGEKDGPDTQSINYTGLIGLLVKEVQDLKKRVSELENEICKTK